MKKRTFALLLVFTTSIFGYAIQAASEWVKYTSVEGRYNVLLPEQPKLSSQEAANPSGQMFTQYMAMASDSDGLLMIAYFDYAADVTFSFDKARDGMIAAVSGRLIEEHAISLGGHSGREMKLSAKMPNGHETITVARFYDVSRRVYIIQHMFLKSAETPSMLGKTSKFFDSFKVTTP